MKKELSNQCSLIDLDDSVLIIIDVQQSFIDKLPEDERKPLISRISWLTTVASLLSVPIVVTAEDIPDSGPTVPEIAQKLPPGTKEHNKMVFGLAADPVIMDYIEKTGRKTAVLVGLETDVCVTHSAIGLMEKGYKVTVVADATASPGTGYNFGIKRMRDVGVSVLSLKGLFYDWVRTVDRAIEFEEKYSDKLKPPEGIIF